MSVPAWSARQEVDEGLALRLDRFHRNHAAQHNQKRTSLLYDKDEQLAELGNAPLRAEVRAYSALGSNISNLDAFAGAMSFGQFVKADFAHAAMRHAARSVGDEYIQCCIDTAYEVGGDRAVTTWLLQNDKSVTISVKLSVDMYAPTSDGTVALCIPWYQMSVAARAPTGTGTPNTTGNPGRGWCPGLMKRDMEEGLPYPLWSLQDQQGSWYDITHSPAADGAEVFTWDDANNAAPRLAMSWDLLSSDRYYHEFDGYPGRLVKAATGGLLKPKNIFARRPDGSAYCVQDLIGATWDSETGEIILPEEDARYEGDEALEERGFQCRVCKRRVSQYEESDTCTADYCRGQKKREKRLDRIGLK